MRPKVKSVEGLHHLRYQLPQQIHASRIYPSESENGSTIVLLGHERGLTVIWRGGKPFKSRQAQGNTRPNDSSEDVMALDTASEDGNERDESATGDEDDEPEFQEEEEEYDPAHPYRSIVQHLNLDIGTGVLDLAVPRLPEKDPSSFILTPEFTDQKMLVALACTDNSIRLLTLPLTPPDPEIKGQKLMEDDFPAFFTTRANWIDSMITVPTAQGHRSPPRGISLALVHRPMSIEDAERESVASDQSFANHAWEIFIASHSADLSGRMLIHRIPVSTNAWDIEQPSADEILWRAERLSEPATSVQIYTSLSTNEAEIPKVLVAGSSGSVRIYECSKESEPEEGYWSLTLHPGFSNSRGTSEKRKILDAQWVLGGHGICALMADGEWGIWDLTPAHLPQTISGNLLTKFTLGGWVNSSPSTQISSVPKSDTRSSLAPMTPNTRKSRQDALFTRPSTPGDITAPTRGGISLQLTNPSNNGNDDDESLLIWHTDNTILIPSLRAHWRAKFKTSNDPFGGGSGSQVRELPQVFLPGEQRTGAVLFPEGEAGPSTFRARTNDYLVTGERSFVIVAAPLQEPARPVEGQDKKEARGPNDQTLLLQGELGVDGLDRMLDDMVHRPPEDNSPTNGVGPKRRKVGFAS